MSSSDGESLEIQEIGDVTVIGFKAKRYLDDPTIQLVDEELCAFVVKLGGKKVMLNFGNVEYLSSTALGKLVLLRKKIETAGGHFCFCNASPRIREELRITGFDRIFKIEPYPDDNMGGHGVMSRLKPPMPSSGRAVSLKPPHSNEDA